MPPRRGEWTGEDPFHNRIHCMVLPYLKGLVIIKCGFFYLDCGSIVYSVFVVIILVYLFRFLTSGIRALSLGRHCGQIFFIFADFFYFFRSRKKRAATFSNFSVYFCAKFAKKGCIYDFLSEKHPIWKKNRPKRSPGSQDIEVLKFAKFQDFFRGRRR